MRLTFITRIDSAMELRVVTSGFVMILPSEAIAFLLQTERSFNLDSVGVVNVFTFLINHGILLRSSQGRPGKTNAMQFAERQVLPIVVDLVRQRPFGIMSRALSIAFNCTDQNIGLVVRVIGKLF